ncbi:hypothetical protein VZT92_014968 [Zoarces viviparus]|uniref:Uncharacterized protein n=1 Tax=Zoarces viviparus TaxID=48416 RepID=A0AAW1EUJ6_ZOAVI
MHGDQSNEKKMGMDRTCVEKRSDIGHQKGKEKEADQETHGEELEKKMQSLNHSWGTIQRLAQDREEWKTAGVVPLMFMSSSLVKELWVSQHNTELKTKQCAPTR